MKKIYSILCFATILISCVSSNNKKENLNVETVLLSYSKGDCLGSCPVYDLQIFNDGNVIYTGVKNVPKKGIYQTKISAVQLQNISDLIASTNFLEAGELKGRDIAITTLRFKNNKIEFQKSKAMDNLLIISDIVEKIVANI